MILEKALTLELTQFETRLLRPADARAPGGVLAALSVVSESFQLLQRNVLTLAGYIVLLVQFSGWAVLDCCWPRCRRRWQRCAFRARPSSSANWRSQESRQLNYLEYVLANDEHAKEVKLFASARCCWSASASWASRSTRRTRSWREAHRLDVGAVAAGDRRLLASYAAMPWPPPPAS